MSKFHSSAIDVDSLHLSPQKERSKAGRIVFQKTIKNLRGAVPHLAASTLAHLFNTRSTLENKQLRTGVIMVRRFLQLSLVRYNADRVWIGTSFSKTWRGNAL